MPLSDQAALVNFGNESGAFNFAHRIRQASPSWLVDIVQAYSAVAVHFDIEQTSYLSVARQLHELDLDAVLPRVGQGATHEIPCCYEMGPDLDRVATHACMSPEQVIEQHLSLTYTVYAIGFCPGFPYLGYLSPALAGVPRLSTPRLRVEPGSVGLTGRQTGIYPEARPGGWNLIGRTPLVLVDIADAYFPLKTGDAVRFLRIDLAAFRQRQGERLPARKPDLFIRN